MIDKELPNKPVAVVTHSYGGSVVMTAVNLLFLFYCLKLLHDTCVKCQIDQTSFLRQIDFSRDHYSAEKIPLVEQVSAEKIPLIDLG